MINKKRKILTLTEKMNIINKIKKWVNKQTLGLSKSTLSDIWKNKEATKNSIWVEITL